MIESPVTLGYSKLPFDCSASLSSQHDH